MNTAKPGCWTFLRARQCLPEPGSGRRALPPDPRARPPCVHSGRGGGDGRRPRPKGRRWLPWCPCRLGGDRQGTNSAGGGGRKAASAATLPFRSALSPAEDDAPKVTFGETSPGRPSCALDGAQCKGIDGGRDTSWAQRAGHGATATREVGTAWSSSQPVGAAIGAARTRTRSRRGRRAAPGTACSRGTAHESPGNVTGRC